MSFTPDELEVNKAKKGTKNRDEKASQVSDRSLEDYCNMFGFEPEDLAGKKILDVGSGRREKFSKQAAEYGAEVFSISPTLAEKQSRREAQSIYLIFRNPKWQRRSVAAQAQEIPFKDKSFDMVTALYSVPYYLERNAEDDDLESRDEYHQALKEMTRVLADGGRLFMAPAYMFELSDEVITWLEENGLSITKSEHGVLEITKNIVEDDELLRPDKE